MSAADRFDDWVRARAESPVPDGFADRVMEGVAAADRERGAVALLAGLLASRPGRVTLLGLGAAACALRAALALGVLFSS